MSESMNDQETGVMELLQRMQKQLMFLEKKIDTLIQQSQQKPSFDRGERKFSRPFRPYGRPHSGPPRHGGNHEGQGQHGQHGHGDRPKKPYFNRGKNR
ncbi:MAG: hypothetical protein HY592_03025 [Candidatus Omnitrophica bacterium]|nr:hypothetical protein [Candidatus Omnitrophota bacterium]